jgi:hypothetical protein
MEKLICNCNTSDHHHQYTDHNNEIVVECSQCGMFIKFAKGETVDSSIPQKPAPEMTARLAQLPALSEKEETISQTPEMNSGLPELPAPAEKEKKQGFWKKLFG